MRLAGFLPLLGAALCLTRGVMGGVNVRDPKGAEGKEVREGPQGLMFGLRVLGFGKDALPVVPQKELLVLGAGMPRTGTKSTKAALELLGYKVLHMEDVQANNLGHDWLLALTSDKLMDRFIEKILSLGFNATLDGPMNLLTVDFFKRFPHAKVLYNVRDSPEEWARSHIHLQTTFRQVWSPPWSWLVDFSFATATYLKYSNVYAARYPACEPNFWTRIMPWWSCRQYIEDEAINVAFHNEQVANIEKAIPKDQILYFNVKQGWGPLEAYLGKKAPSGVAFPQINEASTLNVIGTFLMIGGVAWPFIGLVLLVVFTIVFRKLTDPCFRKHL